MTTLMQRRTNEMQPLARLRDEFEMIFDRILNRWPTPFESDVDLDRLWDLQFVDGENEAIVRAEVPGFEVDEFDVQVAGSVLTIKAEKKQEIEKPDNGGVQKRSLSCVLSQRDAAGRNSGGGDRGEVPQRRAGNSPAQERGRQPQADPR